jgi:hypothetical protein
MFNFRTKPTINGPAHLVSRGWSALCDVAQSRRSNCSVARALPSTVSLKVLVYGLGPLCFVLFSFLFFVPFFFLPEPENLLLHFFIAVARVCLARRVPSHLPGDFLSLLPDALHRHILLGAYLLSGTRVSLPLPLPSAPSAVD